MKMAQNDVKAPRKRKRQPTLKKGLKEALVEKLLDERGWLGEILSEVLEDFALAEAIKEGRKTKKVSRETIFRTLRGKR